MCAFKMIYATLLDCQKRWRADEMQDSDTIIQGDGNLQIDLQEQTVLLRAEMIPS